MSKKLERLSVRDARRDVVNLYSRPLEVNLSNLAQLAKPSKSKRSERFLFYLRNGDERVICAKHSSGWAVAEHPS